MSFHTLTPELQDYIFAISFTWCLGCSNLASHVYTRYFVGSRLNPLVVQCLVKGFICFSMLIIMSSNKLFSTSAAWTFISIPIGILGGWFVVSIEILLNRYVQCQNNRLKIISVAKRGFYYTRTGPSKAILSLTSNCRSRYNSNLRKLHEKYAEHETRQMYFSIITILLIAVFEEIIFRGYLVQLCFLLPSSVTKAALIFTVIIFGLSHASFGLCQIVAKIILGGCCMASVLVCHTLLPALVMHGYLNWFAFQCQNR